MDTLSSLRTDLKQSYHDFYSWTVRRKLIVKNIFVHKQGQASFVPEIEKELYQDPFFKTAEIKEILSLSLIVESHAAEFSDYPRWSEGAHLNTKTHQLYEQINPLMLLQFNRELFLKLDLSEDYLFLRNYL